MSDMQYKLEIHLCCFKQWGHGVTVGLALQLLFVLTGINPPTSFIEHPLCTRLFPYRAARRTLELRKSHGTPLLKTFLASHLIHSGSPIPSTMTGKALHFLVPCPDPLSSDSPTYSTYLLHWSCWPPCCPQHTKHALCLAIPSGMPEVIWPCVPLWFTTSPPFLKCHFFSKLFLSSPHEAFDPHSPIIHIPPVFSALLLFFLITFP